MPLGQGQAARGLRRSRKGPRPERSVDAAGRESRPPFTVSDEGRLAGAARVWTAARALVGASAFAEVGIARHRLESGPPIRPRSEVPGGVPQRRGSGALIGRRLKGVGSSPARVRAMTVLRSSVLVAATLADLIVDRTPSQGLPAKKSAWTRKRLTYATVAGKRTCVRVEPTPVETRPRFRSGARPLLDSRDLLPVISARVLARQESSSGQLADARPVDLLAFPRPYCRRATGRGWNDLLGPGLKSAPNRGTPRRAEWLPMTRERRVPGRHDPPERQ